MVSFANHSSKLPDPSRTILSRHTDFCWIERSGMNSNLIYSAPGDLAGMTMICPEVLQSFGFHISRSLAQASCIHRLHYLHHCRVSSKDVLPRGLSLIRYLIGTRH